jgi:hypothetical protein
LFIDVAVAVAVAVAVIAASVTEGIESNRIESNRIESNQIKCFAVRCTVALFVYNELKQALLRIIISRQQSTISGTVNRVVSCRVVSCR